MKPRPERQGAEQPNADSHPSEPQGARNNAQHWVVGFQLPEVVTRVGQPPDDGVWGGTGRGFGRSFPWSGCGSGLCGWGFPRESFPGCGMLYVLPRRSEEGGFEAGNKKASNIDKRLAERVGKRSEGRELVFGGARPEECRGASQRGLELDGLRFCVIFGARLACRSL